MEDIAHPVSDSVITANRIQIFLNNIGSLPIEDQNRAFDLYWTNLDKDQFFEFMLLLFEQTLISLEKSINLFMNSPVFLEQSVK